MTMEQLVFLPESKDEVIDREMKKLREAHDKTRKSQFAKISSLQKSYDDLKHKLDVLEMALCRCGINPLHFE